MLYREIGITDIEGVLVGHAQRKELGSGCTAVLVEKGALCGCDVRDALQRLAPDIVLAAIPKVLFNADGVMLDDMTLGQLQEQAPLPLHVVSCEASEYLPQLQALIEQGGASCQSIS